MAEFLLFASRYFFEFQSCHCIDSPPPISKSSTTDHYWIPPDVGYLKLNTDATVEDGFLTVGVGLVIRDSVGLVLGCASVKIHGSFSAYVAELLALLERLRFAHASGLRVKFIESDASNTIKVIKFWVTCWF
ncbi:Ribonuclease H-like domain containing protein [Trema orientale]|uniref:Ribonuclease H-like domain containing protein n=1 Tax=Trema orientale TaxID=63057 RepID=A0A2P5EDB6_TREOI|nr:Ribonuclease H-like domain containing protein [Trema orientale]